MNNTFRFCLRSTALSVVLLVTLFAVRSAKARDVTEQTMLDVMKNYQFRAAETAVTSDVLVLRRSDWLAKAQAASSSTVSTTVRPSDLTLDLGYVWAMYRLDAIEIWWPGVVGSPAQQQPNFTDEVTSAVFTRFMGDARPSGVFKQHPAEHPVSRNKAAYKMAAQLTTQSLIMQDVVAGEETLREIHRRFPQLPPPLGIYIDYADAGGLSIY